METEDIGICNKCGVLFCLSKCSIQQVERHCGYVEKSGIAICPLCEEEIYYE